MHSITVLFIVFSLCVESPRIVDLRICQYEAYQDDSFFSSLPYYTVKNK